MTLLEPVVAQHRLFRDLGLRIGLGGVTVLFLLFLSLKGCGAEPEQATVRLIWDPVNDSRVTGYYIHYGKRSPNQPGSCAYGQDRFVSSSQGTVTGLDRGSIYYFAVSAYNGVEGNCSNEVSAHT